MHAQVPVDVATFLLNEKRVDLQMIETRHKVTVMLIPNVHLETPNYTVTRMRHDDLNKTEPLPASYEMVTLPAEEVKTPPPGQEAPPPGRRRQSRASPLRSLPRSQCRSRRRWCHRPVAAPSSAVLFAWFRRAPAPSEEPAKPTLPQRGQRRGRVIANAVGRIGVIAGTPSGSARNRALMRNATAPRPSGRKRHRGSSEATVQNGANAGSARIGVSVSNGASAPSASRLLPARRIPGTASAVGINQCKGIPDRSDRA